MQPNTLKILAAFGEHETLTIAQVDDMLPDICDSGSKGAVMSLLKMCLVASDRVSHYPAYYTITAAGRKFLLALSGDKSGTVAKPRDSVLGGNFPGTRWRIRDGGQDHLAHPSRRGDEYVEHRPMISMSGTTEAVGIHGGRF